MPLTLPRLHREPEHASLPDAKQLWHLFVDSVRFWSMIAIVAQHGTGAFNLVGGASPWLDQVLRVPLKFGTIGFFLISGFLLGERLQTCPRLPYLGRRLQRVFLPWFLWVSLLVIYLLFIDVEHHRLLLTLHNLLPAFAHKFKYCLLTTSFWFVPNLILSITVLMIFRRYLYDLRLGAVLLAVYLVYVANLYTLWFSSSHLEALFGFVFDLWLGSYASRHIDAIHRWITEVRLSTLVVLSTLTCVLAFADTRWLAYRHAPDPTNTLRFSNQLFSIAVVLLILKLRRATWPRFLNVRRDTFGIYLTHILVLDILLSLARRALPVYLPTTQLARHTEGILLWIGITIAAYLACIAITRAIAAQPSLQGLVGAEFPASTPRKFPRFLHRLPIPRLRRAKKLPAPVPE